jgi:hypothetical protein
MLYYEISHIEDGCNVRARYDRVGRRDDCYVMEELDISGRFPI